MNSIFVINGGAGRVLCSIPALEKFQQNNPDDDFVIALEWWAELFENHPTLSDKVVDMNAEDCFEKYFIDRNPLQPEPYLDTDFYTCKKNLVQSFDKLINNTDDHSDVYSPSLFLSEFEQHNGMHLTNSIKKDLSKKKLVVFQPYGSTSQLIGGEIVDFSGRGIPTEKFLKISKLLCSEAVVCYMGPPDFYLPNDVFSSNLFNINPTLRTYMSIINCCDAFIGCDSVGQHIARSFEKPATVLMGTTIEKNVSYPDYEKFKFFRKPDFEPTYHPMRLGNGAAQKAERLNKGIMNFTDQECIDIAHMVLEQIDA